jgi:predicted DNA-binding transcriptional regulator AlpA
MHDVSQSTLSKRARLESAMYSLNDTASLFGMGYTTLWTAVQAGTFPITPVKIGRQYKFPKRLVDRLLGLEDVAEPQDAA